ncbi:hypothetical protein [Campylobacter hominis]|nr:hypothetical protein K8O82_03655 [Campylobacter hominis]
MRKCTGNGNDTINGGNGNDIIYAGNGDDNVGGDDGDDNKFTNLNLLVA